MNWFYESSGQQQGPVSDSEFDRLIAEGRITPNTLVWNNDMADWRPLREVRPSAAPIAGAMTAPPLPSSGAPGGTVACASCGRAFPPSEVIQIGDRPICPDCKPAVLQSLQQGGGLPSGPDGFRTGPPWEQRQQLGFVKAGWETFKAVMFQPTETFATMRRGGDLAGPLWYYVITGTIGGTIGLGLQLLLQVAGLMPTLANQPGFNPAGFRALGLGMGVGALVFIVLMPLLLALYAFLIPGVMHVSLMICGGAKQPFETTFRVVNYVFGSVSLFQVVPLCGPLLGLVWGLVCVVIGLTPAHEISTGRAVCAVLLPVVLCCGIVIAASVAIFGMIAAAQQGGATFTPTVPMPQ